VINSLSISTYEDYTMSLSLAYMS